MKIAQWLSLWFSGKRPASEPVRLRIVNVTRQIDLANSVGIAGDGRTRRKGLLGTSSLSEGGGLWIVPCEAVHTFGMKYSIDLVYLDRHKKVKKVRHRVPSGRMSACFTAYSVLELASGSVRKTGTMPGDKLEFLSASPQASAGMV